MQEAMDPKQVQVVCTSLREAVDVKQAVNDFSVMFTLRAPMHKSEKRIPMQLVAVIDRSGSMQSLLPLVKQTLDFVIHQLTSEDSLAVVTYDSVIETPLSLTRMTPQGKQVAASMVASITERGCTNLAGGLFRGMQVVQQSSENYSVSTVMLFTDGLANEGVTVTSEIIRLMRDREYITKFDQNNPNAGAAYAGPAVAPMLNAMPVQQQMQMPVQQQQMQMPVQQQQQSSWLPSFLRGRNSTASGNSSNSASESKDENSSTSSSKSGPEGNLAVPCTVYTFGFGSDHNGVMLREIADAGRGVYYYIQDESVIGPSFADCLGGLMSTVARDLRVTISPGMRTTVLDVLTRYGKERITDENGNNCIVVTIPDMQSEETRDLVVKVSLTALDEPLQYRQPVASAHLTYWNVITERKYETDCIGSIWRLAADQLTRENTQVSPQIDAQLNRVAAVDAMAAADDLARGQNLEAARRLLQQCIARIRGSVSAEFPLCQNLIKDLERLLSQYADQATWASKGSHSTNAYMGSHVMQRANLQTADTYSNQQRCAAQVQWSAFSKK